MEILETIKKRASLKLKLSPREVEQEKIHQILEAAIVAPSGRNRQPWHFIVVRDKKIIESMVNRCFNEVNLVAKEAPVIIVACANPSDAIITAGKEYYLFDLGLAVENMVLTATSLGLATHIMAGLNEEELKKSLGIPAEFRVVVAIPVAYPTGDSYEKASEERLSQRTRKTLPEMVHANIWATPFQSQ